MIFQVYFIVLPTVPFCLANLLVSYPNPCSFSIRAPNPVSGPESTFGPVKDTSSYLNCISLCFLLLPFALLTF